MQKLMTETVADANVHQVVLFEFDWTMASRQNGSEKKKVKLFFSSKNEKSSIVTVCNLERKDRYD